MSFRMEMGRGRGDAGTVDGGRDRKAGFGAGEGDGEGRNEILRWAEVGAWSWEIFDGGDEGWRIEIVGGVRRLGE